jgi:2,3-dihydroxyphenylpropionate 1,2-dioxygenase
MTSRLVCVSHSPIIMIRAKAPAEEGEILAYYQASVEAIGAFDPELVIVFGTDHFAGFFYSLMPSYCIGAKASAVNDVGGFAGDLDVPADLAIEMIRYLRDCGFDPALSRQMKVDHAFSQPLHRLLGELDAKPVIPVFIDALSEPLLRFGRSRSLGKAIGSFAASTGKRVLFLGSGGLSHHPTRYYPLMGQASSEVSGWQLDGERGGTMTEQHWLQRLREMHEEGAFMLIDGRRTREDISLNPEFDAWVIERLSTGDYAALDVLDPGETVKRAGIGIMELHAWVAACAAHDAAGGSKPDKWLYAPALEYGIGYGMLTAGLSEKRR